MLQVGTGGASTPIPQEKDVAEPEGNVETRRDSI